MKKTITIIICLFCCIMSFHVSATITFAEDVYTEGDYTYRLVDGEAEITGYSGTEENVVVPAKLSKYKVCGIAQGTFLFNETIKTLTISEGITYLAAETISFTNVESIHLPSTLESVYGTSIYGNEKLEEITLAKGSDYLTVYNGDLYTKDMKKLLFHLPMDTREVLVVPDGVEVIGDDSCRDNIYLKEVRLPDSVTYIGYFAFTHDRALEKINISKNCEVIGQYALQNTAIKMLHISASVTDIIPGAFYNMTELKSISVDSKNLVYRSIDGVLYSEESLICYPKCHTGDTLVIPEGITGIVAGGINPNNNLENIYLASTVTWLEWDAIRTEDNHHMSICFAGDMPSMDERSIRNSSGGTEIGISCYYPKNNDTWDLSLLPEFIDMEQIEWIGYEGEAKIPEQKPETEQESESEQESQTEQGTTLKNKDGKWYYYEDGTWVKDKYDFVNYEEGIFLVANGVLATKVNGLAQDPNDKNTWYFVANGQVQTQYTGLAEYDGAWFYVEQGKLNTSLAGYVEYDGGLFYVGAGRILMEVNGLAQDPNNVNTWYYLANGQAQTQYTGLTQYDGEWFYVENGILAQNYTGNVIYDGNTFYVVNGMLR